MSYVVHEASGGSPIELPVITVMRWGGCVVPVALSTKAGSVAPVSLRPTLPCHRLFDGASMQVNKDTVMCRATSSDYALGADSRTRSYNWGFVAFL